jgi:hypothetical protein
MIWMNHQQSAGSLTEIGAGTHPALDSTRRATHGPRRARRTAASEVPDLSTSERRQVRRWYLPASSESGNIADTVGRGGSPSAWRRSRGLV